MRIRELPSPSPTGLVLGVLVGIVDAIILQTGIGASQGPLGVAPFTWPVVIWTWATVGCLTGAIVSSPRWGRLRGVALALSGPCLLLLGRATTPVKALLRISTLDMLMIWLAVSVAICVACAFLRFQPARAAWKYAAGATLSAVLLVFFAADVRLGGTPAQRTPVRGKHNVALIVLDTVRHDDAFAHMPELSAFAQRAASFDDAWSSAPWTVPAHFALLTGADAWTVPFRNIREGFEYPGTRLGEHFQQRGYATAAVFANPLLNEGAGFAHGFDDFAVSLQSRVCRSAIGVLLGKVVVHGGPRMPVCGWFIATDVTARATKFVQGAEKPFFIAMNFMDAHDPYYVRPECRERSFRAVARRDQQAVLDARPGRPLDPDIGRRTHEQYRLAMRCMDRSLGALLRTLDDGDTVIAIVGDHGEQFGEHQFGGHGNSLFRQVLHVPLILKVPGRAPARVTEPVSTTDLYTSLIRAAEPDRARTPITLFDASRRRPVLSNFDMRRRRSRDGGFSVVRDDLHFIRSDSLRETLFNYADDPAEVSPLGLPAAGPLREIVLRATARQRHRAEFDALGYLN